MRGRQCHTFTFLCQLDKIYVYSRTIRDVGWEFFFPWTTVS